jgi:hypothetical protein
MLLLRVPSTPAQPAQDVCAAYTGQAQRICRAAVAAGCFNGVQSPDCDALTTTWNERCDVCDGPAPWGPPCPCNLDGLNAEALHAEMVSMGGVIAFVGCTDKRKEVSVFITGIDQDGEFTQFFPRMGVQALTLSDGVSSRCAYFLNDAQGFPVPPPRACKWSASPPGGEGPVARTSEH